MDLNLFKKRIQNTALLTGERKTHFLSRAELYSPDTRTKMINALMEHEKNFLETTGQKKQEANRKALMEKMTAAEAVHKKEIEAAESALLEDLEEIEQEEKEVEKKKDLENSDPPPPQEDLETIAKIKLIFYRRAKIMANVLLFLAIIVFFAWKMEWIEKIQVPQKIETKIQKTKNEIKEQMKQSAPKRTVPRKSIPRKKIKVSPRNRK